MTDFVYHKDLEGYVEPAKPAAPCRPEPKELSPCLVGGKVALEPIKPCTKCNGDGFKLVEGYTYKREDGTVRVRESAWETCSYCNGAGWFHAPDIEAIVGKVKGRKPRSLKSKRPEDTRSYFVWRMARFHGGVDVCLPMVASIDIAGDPYEAILDELAKVVAKAYFGSGNVGTARWHQAMYGSHSFEDLPQYIDSPVHDGNKPPEEILETV